MLDQVVDAARTVAESVVGIVGVRTAETPAYEVATTLGEVEIRRYGPRAAAETLVEGMAEEAARGEGFRRLAGYIFGANKGAAKLAMTAPVVQIEGARIAMTAPVATTRQGAGFVVRFLLPGSVSAEAAPEPNDRRVRIVPVPPQTVAVLRFAGSTSTEPVAERKRALLAALEKTAWRAEGEVEAWFYDPPWTLPPLRRNEVAVGVVGGPAG